MMSLTYCAFDSVRWAKASQPQFCSAPTENSPRAPMTPRVNSTSCAWLVGVVTIDREVTPNGFDLSGAEMRYD